MWGRVASLVAVFAVVGCGTTTKPIYGDWVFTDLGGETHMTFNKDGTYTTFFVHKGAKVNQSGTFSLTGTWLHIIPEKVTTDNPQLQAAYDREHLARMVMRAKWEGENTLRLSMAESKATQLMTRISTAVK